jgi:hypothetical protein
MVAFYRSPDGCRQPSGTAWNDVEVILEVGCLAVCVLRCGWLAAQPATIVLTDHANAGVIAAQAPVGVETGGFIFTARLAGGDVQGIRILVADRGRRGVSDFA